LQLQRDLASVIARAVAGRLTSNEGLGLAVDTRQVNPQAYEGLGQVRLVVRSSRIVLATHCLSFGVTPKTVLKL